MADGFPKNIRRTSESHAFQQVLRRNPALALRADRDRDAVALTFDRAARAGVENLAVFEAVFRGYRPEILYTEPYPQPAPVVPVEPPGTFNASCNDALIFELAAGDESIPDAFAFGATTGNAMMVTIDLTALGPGVELEVNLDTLTDDCMLFLLKPGFDPYDTDPSHYFQDPGETLGPTNQSWTIPWSTLSTYPSLVFHVVIFHKSSLPLVSGVFRVFCLLPPVSITSANVNGIRPGVATTLELTGVSFLHVETGTLSGGGTVSDVLPIDFSRLELVVTAGSAGLKQLAVTSGDPPSTSPDFPLLFANFPTAGSILRGGNIAVTLAAGDNHLTTTSAATVNGVSTTFAMDSTDPNKLLILVPPSATPGPATVTITTSAGTFNFPNVVVIAANPYISSLEPGTAVQTTGSFLLNVHGDHFIDVDFARVTGTSGNIDTFPFVIVDDTLVQVFVNDGSLLSLGPVPVRLHNAAGLSNAVNLSYVSPLQVTSLSPNTVLASGGAFSILGSNLTNADTTGEVFLGPSDHPSAVTVVSDSELDVTTGALTPGIYAVSITDEDGTSGSASLLVYTISATSVLIGDSFSMTGDFSAVVAVTVGGFPVDAFTITGGGSGINITPYNGMATGPADIVLSTSSISFTIPSGVTMTSSSSAPAPTSVLIGITRPGGSLANDYLFGDSFVTGATVDVYSGSTFVASCSLVSVKNPRCISFRPPTGLTSGTIYNLRVTNPDAQIGTLVGGLEVWEPVNELAGVTAGEGNYLSPSSYNTGTGTWSGTNFNATVPGTSTPGGWRGDGLSSPYQMPVFNGVDQYLNISASLGAGTFGWNVLANIANGTVIMGFVAHKSVASGATKPPPDADVYNNGALIAGDGASPTLAVSDMGAKVVAYDGASYQAAYAGKMTVCEHHVLTIKWDAGSTSLKIRVDDGEWVTKSMAAGGLDGGGGSNVGPTTDLGRSYAGTQYFKGILTFGLMLPLTAADDISDKAKRWSYARGLLKFEPAKTGPSVCFKEGFYDGTGGSWSSTITGGAAATAALAAPPDAGGGVPLFSSSSSSLAVAGVPMSTWSDADERHYYAKVTTTSITSTNHTTSITSNQAIISDSASSNGIFLHKNGSSFYADFYDYAGAADYARVDITSLVDSSGAGTFSIQAKKAHGRLYIRANNGPWYANASVVGATTTMTGVFTIGANGFRGSVNYAIAWAHELPNFLSEKMAIYGGVTDPKAFLYQEEGLVSIQDVRDADFDGSSGSNVVTFLPDTAFRQDPNRHMAPDPIGTGGPYLTYDGTEPKMGSVAEGDRRVRSSLVPSGAASTAPFQVPSDSFAEPSTQPFTVYIVLDNDGTSTVYWMLNAAGSGASASNLFGTGSSVSIGVQSLLGTTIGTGKRVICIVFDGTSTSLYDNDHATPVTTGDGGAGSGNSLSMGAWESTPTWDIYLRAEYSGAHSAAQRQAIMSGLGARFGITTT